jgi:hypothetical protein
MTSRTGVARAFLAAFTLIGIVAGGSARAEGPPAPAPQAQAAKPPSNDTALPAPSQPQVPAAPGTPADQEESSQAPFTCPDRGGNLRPSV